MRTAALFLVVWVIFTVCPPFPSFDSYWTVPVAVSLLERGDTNIDEYLARMPQAAHYTVECVAPGKSAVWYLADARVCAEGHAYNLYPLAVSILVLPMVAALLLLVKLPLAGLVNGAHPAIAAFLAGDFLGGHAVAELLCGALIAALAVAVMERVLREFVPARVAMVLTLALAFGTAVWSTASRSLFQHGPLMLMFNLTLLLVVKARREERWIRYAALSLAGCYVLRPTGAIWVAVLTVYVWRRHRAQFVAFVAWALPVAVPFLAYNVMVRHSLLPAYFTMSSPVRMFSYGETLLMHFVSPSRGLFVFSPFLAVGVFGWVLAWKRRWLFPALPYLFVGWVLYTMVSGGWWPGHGYGPRYLNDTAPLLILLMVPVYEWLREQAPQRQVWLRAAFGLMLVWSVLVHGHGATSAAAQQWNIQPTNIDVDPGRVWDWRDPQFLRF